MTDCCGLVTLDKEQVPLKSIEVQLQVRDHVATVVSTLNYHNQEDKPIEAVFVFSLPGDAAVCHFSATIGQTQIVAEVKEKEQAHEDYEDALSSVQQAFLLEESEENQDVFLVGSVHPGESASIRLEYVTELAFQADESLRFCLPGVLNPPYQSQVESSCSLDPLQYHNTEKTQETVVPPGECASIMLEYDTELTVQVDEDLSSSLPALLNPPYQSQEIESSSIELTSVPASLVPYSLSFSARLSSSRPISKVESSCSLDPLQYLNTEKTQATVKLAAGHKFDRDVELLIYYEDAHQPTAVVEAGQASTNLGTVMGDPAVMLSIYPEFPEAVSSSTTSDVELIFLLSRSESMDYFFVHDGDQRKTRFRNARDTLLLVLKSLPMNCFFNIFSFGFSYEHIFLRSVKYNEDTVEEALRTVKSMKANLGIANILEPLKYIYSEPCHREYQKKIFIFTDGEVTNIKEVLQLVKNNSQKFFFFLIGEEASPQLINGLAKVEGGHTHFITGTERLQTTVMQSLRFALKPYITDVSVEWNLPMKVFHTNLSPPIKIMYEGERALIYTSLTIMTKRASEGSVVVQYCLKGHLYTCEIQFSLKPVEGPGLAVHRLGARSLIRTLMKEKNRIKVELNRKKVVKLSMDSGVSSAYTAFVALINGTSKIIHGPLVCRNVPTPVDYDFEEEVCSLDYKDQDEDEKVYIPEEHLEHLEIIDIIEMLEEFEAFPLTESEESEESEEPDSDEEFIYFLETEIEELVKDLQDFKISKVDAQDFDLYEELEYFEETEIEELVEDLNFHIPDKLSAPEEEDEDSADSWEPPTDPWLQIVFLQKAAGWWQLDPNLSTALEKTNEMLEKEKPTSINEDVWATILALIWLHGFKAEAREEWNLVAIKAVSWLRDQNVPDLTECLEAANVLLGCTVQKESLGLGDMLGEVPDDVVDDMFDDMLDDMLDEVLDDTGCMLDDTLDDMLDDTGYMLDDVLDDVLDDTGYMLDDVLDDMLDDVLDDMLDDVLDDMLDDVLDDVLDDTG